MKVLVTGGAGFIGSGVALRLGALGHEVTVLDSLSSQIHGFDPQADSPLYRSIQGKVRFVRGSVCDRAAFCEVLVGQEAIVHMAAETGTGQSMYEVERYTDVNVRGTGLMLELVAKQFRSVRKIVLASSRAVYGEGKYWSESAGIVYPESRREADMAQGRFDILWGEKRERLTPMATDEESLLHPNSVYGVTKQSQEQLLSIAAHALGIPHVVLRYQNVYGPGQSLGNPYTGVLSVFSVRLLNANPIDIYEDGEETRDFVYIEDVIDATVAALLNDGVRNVVIGVGTGVPTSIMAVAQILARLYGVDVPIAVTGAYRVGDIRHNYADLTRARDLLAFRPAHDISSGLAQFVNWVREQEVGDDRYERSVQEMRAHGLYRSQSMFGLEQQIGLESGPTRDLKSRSRHLLGVVTVTYNSAAVIEGFLRSALSQTMPEFLLYIIDNASGDNTLALIVRCADTRIHLVRNPENVGVAEGNNQGILMALEARCDRVLLINNDTEFEDRLFEKMAHALDRQKADMIVPKIMYFDRKT